MIMIDDLLDLPISRLKGKSEIKVISCEKKHWKSQIYYIDHSVHLGSYEDPWTASLVFSIVEEEIKYKRKNLHTIPRNKRVNVKGKVNSVPCPRCGEYQGLKKSVDIGEVMDGKVLTQDDFECFKCKKKKVQL